MNNKVFKMNDYEWWATSGTLGSLIGFYDKNVNSIENIEELEEIKECDINSEGTWCDVECTDEIIEKLSGKTEYYQNKEKRMSGDTKYRFGAYYIFKTFAEIMENKQIEIPYCIAGIE